MARHHGRELPRSAWLLPVLRDKHALIIVEDKPAVLATTPADDPFPAVQRFEMQAKLSDAGVLDGKRKAPIAEILKSCSAQFSESYRSYGGRISFSESLVT